MHRIQVIADKFQKNTSNGKHEMIENSLCTVITAGRSTAERYSAAAEIAHAYYTWREWRDQRKQHEFLERHPDEPIQDFRSGSCSINTCRHSAPPSRKPIFVVSPESDPNECAKEVARLGVPSGTGVLLRTSGSTSGQGKIVALSWEALEASAAAAHEYFGGGGAWINVLPLYHIAGFQTVFRSLFSGFEPIIGDFTTFADFKAATAASPAPRHYLSQVPAQLARLLASVPAGSPENPGGANKTAQHGSAEKCGIDVNLVGGSSINIDLLQRANKIGMRTVTSYGMTETCGGCVYDGLPIGDVRLSISRSGQISICSKVVSLGYLGNLAAPDFSEDYDGMRWHHTRDWGEITPAGILQVNGRIDDAITTGGLTVIPQLVEDAIAAYFHTQCVVVGIPNKDWGEEVIAITAQKIPAGRVREFVKTRFEHGWEPRQVYALAEVISPQPGENINRQLSFPLTASGKINRRELEKLVNHFLERSSIR